MIHTINPKPKDIHEGTLNCLCMARNSITRAQESAPDQHGEVMGHVREAGYQLDDLIDQVFNRALVITKRVEPLDHAAMDKLIHQARTEGYNAGRLAADNAALAKVRAQVSEALRAVL